MQEKQFQAIILVEPQVVKASEDEKFIGYFEGIASTPDVDLEGDKFTPEVLAKNAERLKGKPILLLHGKNKEVGDQPIGEILEAKFENGVLKIKAGIYKAFKKIWDAVKRGVLKALSIGGIISLRGWGKLADRFGNRSIFPISHIGMMVATAAWVLVDEEPLGKSLTVLIFLAIGIFNSGNGNGVKEKVFQKSIDSVSRSIGTMDKLNNGK